ncbi:hypothetical protein ACFTTN_35580 [Streptomyces niveus]|uniref:hypothetical protein n=1 Tax=Streptomyces niveus TaxID=193462 RepID=UPI003643BAE2
MQIQPTTEQLKLLEPLISRPRLAPFLAATATPAAAMELYLWNVRLSAAFGEVMGGERLVEAGRRRLAGLHRRLRRCGRGVGRGLRVLCGTAQELEALLHGFDHADG